MASTKPLKFKTVEIFEKKVNEYFEKGGRPVGKNGDRLYTVTGLAVYLNIDRTSLWDYGNREGYDKILTMARARVENTMEELAMVGIIDRSVTIFSLKNNFKWTDRTEVELGTETHTTLNISVQDTSV